MLLRNLYNVQNNECTDISISGSIIEAILPHGERVPNEEKAAIDFTDAIVFPGLINSHDHLDFNLYPSLGKGNYDSYVEWGADIHEQNKELISNIQRIPKELRIQWGIYKNLLNGITTVVNHGDHIETGNELINVFQEYHMLHSPQFEKNWKYKLNKLFISKLPFVMHIGEGKNAAAWEEINSVIKWNIFKRKIYAVHGIAMDNTQARSFEALIWCPYSNYFLVGKTADISNIKYNTNILFGTDSTISASWNLWEHLRMALKEKTLSSTQLFDTMTRTPADTWGFTNRGRLLAGYDADIVIAKKKKNMERFEAFYALNPEDILMVIHKGNIRMFDNSLLQQLSCAGINTNTFSKILVNEEAKYVEGDLPSLMTAIKSNYSDIVFPANITA